MDEYARRALPVKPTAWSLAGAGAATLAVPASAWASAYVVGGDAADALLRTSAMLVIAAPIAGVVCVSRLKPRLEPRLEHSAAPGWRPARALMTVVAWVALVVATSATLSGLALGADAIVFIATSHAAIACVSLALAAVGALFAVMLDEPLDAAACAGVASVVAGGGLLVAGAWIGNAPPSLVTLAVDSSPFVAMASAARIDVVRLDLFYRISPLAHLGVEYPAWYATCAWYGAAAAAFLVSAGVRSMTRAA
jgi:hypothetical protein